MVGKADVKMVCTHFGPRVAYNVQAAVDSKHCLILYHAVTHAGTDNQQLEPVPRLCSNSRHWTSPPMQATPMASTSRLRRRLDYRLCAAEPRN